MLSEILNYLRNWFETRKIFSAFRISDGDITLASGGSLPLVSGQYFRIVGSVFNDGVHVYGDADLQDESFSGAIWAMAIPPDVIALAEEIKTWSETNETALSSPYQSESFGGYSYSLKSGNGTSGVTWQSQFADRLAPWRKI